MTKARDLANIISGGFTVDDLPTLTASQIPNLDAAKITSGSFADARIAASNVSQHVTSFDDNKIINDISTLGLRVHTQENLNASNTNSASFDVFQDSSAISNLTNCTRDTNEFISTGTASNATPRGDNSTILLVQARGLSNGSTSFTDTATNTPGQTTILSSAPVISNAQSLPNSEVSVFFDGNDIMYNDTNSPSSSAFQGLGGETNIAVEFWIYKISSPANAYASSGVSCLDIGQILQFEFDSSEKLTAYYRNVTVREQTPMSTNAWHHVAWQKQGNTARFYIDGVQVDSGAPGGGITSGNLNDNLFRWGAHRNTGSRYFDGYMDILRVHVQNVFPDGTSFTASTRGYPGSTNATGSFEGNAITASSTSSMGAVITYQDQAGVNTLNTDIILKLSADNGSNYSTATLTALPDFSTGIKMA